VATLKHNSKAIQKHGQDAFVFLSRKGNPVYRESEIMENGQSIGVRIDNAISGTFNRLVKDLKMEGVTFYRLRHTAKTLAMKSRDAQAVALLMGHKEAGIGRVYDHSQISLKRLRRVALAIKHGLWGKPRHAKIEPGKLRLAS
jgi:integrase